jgi:hypothetical protein
MVAVMLRDKLSLPLRGAQGHESGAIQQEVNDVASADMGPWRTQLRQQPGVGAAGVFEGERKDGEARRVKVAGDRGPYSVFAATLRATYMSAGM